MRLWRGLLVLNYHQVVESASDLRDTALWSATPAELDRQLRFLKRSFEIVAPDAISRATAGGRARVLITFDDGYRNNHELAYPILRDHGVPAAFFLATGYLDRPRLPWWDEIATMVRVSTATTVPAGEWLDADLAIDRPQGERAIARLLETIKGLPWARTEAFLDHVAAALDTPRPGREPEPELWMSWEMVRELRDNGMTIGAHTVNHPVLARLDAAEQRAEIGGSLDRLEDELGARPRLFSYPVGLRDSFDGTTRAALTAAGVEHAFSFYGGLNRESDWDPHDLRRVSVSQSASPAIFRATATLPQAFGRW